MSLKNFILLFFAGSLFLLQSFQSEFIKTPSIFDPSAYYELNETKKFTNFEIKWLIDLMIEHPTLKVKFGQTITKQESVRIAQKRMTNFEKSLKKGDVDMSRITFETSVYFLDENDIDQRSRIQGVILSLD